jgi:hypothetical protein
VSFASLVDNEHCWTDVAYALLNRIRLPEQLADEIKHHVSPFCESHGLNVEEVLVAYIYDVVCQSILYHVFLYYESFTGSPN